MVDTSGDISRDEVDAVQIQIQHYYFNGLDISASLSDLGIMIMLDGQPQAKLSMSFITAKSLANYLSKAVEHFEKTTSHELLTMDEVQKAMEAAR